MLLNRRFKKSYTIKYRKLYSTKIQYVSDLHVDCKQQLPIIHQETDYLIVAGDIGVVNHKHVKLFITDCSKKYKKTFIVAGNHEYNCSAIYNYEKINHYKPILKQLCDLYDNVYLLDNQCYEINNLVIAGTTLWSSPYIINKENLLQHHQEYVNNVTWIENLCKKHINKKIVMVSHYVPTFKLIDPKYIQLGPMTNSLFTSNLEYLIKPPIVAWICGHTHSVLEVNINGIYCGVNALGHGKNECETKIINIE